MIGSNSMNLNQATMMDALQHYFDTVLFAEGRSPKIKSVKRGMNNHSEDFIVEFSSEEKATK